VAKIIFVDALNLNVCLGCSLYCMMCRYMCRKNSFGKKCIFFCSSCVGIGTVVPLVARKVVFENIEEKYSLKALGRSGCGVDCRLEKQKIHNFAVQLLTVFFCLCGKGLFQLRLNLCHWLHSVTA